MLLRGASERRAPLAPRDRLAPRAPRALVSPLLLVGRRGGVGCFALAGALGLALPLDLLLLPSHLAGEVGVRVRAGRRDRARARAGLMVRAKLRARVRAKA